MKRLLLILLLLWVTAGCRKSPDPKDVAAPSDRPEPVTLKIGHVGHDHHLALFVACDYADQFTAAGITLKKVQDQKRYELFEHGQKIADIEIVKVGGGSKMPAALAQGIIDIGFGGVAAVIASADSGAPVKLISPLHSKGDMFVVKPDWEMETWQDFVRLVKLKATPMRVGYKNPVAVAKLIFEDALRHEGIMFSQDLSQSDVQVHMINTKGGGKLNISLGSGLIDGYVGNNPFPSIAVEQKIGKIVCDLEDLPPGNFKNHPCCCIAANSSALEEKAIAVQSMLTLFLQATATINTDPDKAITTAMRWIGTSEAVESMSIPTSGYSMEQSADWQATMNKWIEAMNAMGTLTGKLTDMSGEETCGHVYDMTLLNKAKKLFEAP